MGLELGLEVGLGYNWSYIAIADCDRGMVDPSVRSPASGSITTCKSGCASRGVNTPCSNEWLMPSVFGRNLPCQPVRGVNTREGMPLVTRLHELQAEQRRETQWHPRVKILWKTRTVLDAPDRNGVGLQG